MAPTRREVLVAALSASVCACVLEPRAHAAPAPFEVVEVHAKGGPHDRFALLVPRHLARGAQVRLLVALHGLGESGDPALGLRAWLDLYGLRSAYARLTSPPIVRTSKRNDVDDATLAALNASLAAVPFTGLAVACPFTPSFRKWKDPAGALGDFGDWLVKEVVPSAAKVAPIGAGPAFTAIDGCSMGGPYALDVFLRHPAAFGSVGVVQPAMGEHRAAGYAERLAGAVASVGPRPLQLLSSTGDPFLGATRALDRELARRKVPRRLVVLPGPHDQPWLREAGTLSMVLFHERPA